jgi:hypothetical protein
MLPARSGGAPFRPAAMAVTASTWMEHRLSDRYSMLRAGRARLAACPRQLAWLDAAFLTYFCFIYGVQVNYKIDREESKETC